MAAARNHEEAAALRSGCKWRWRFLTLFLVGLEIWAHPIVNREPRSRPAALRKQAGNQPHARVRASWELLRPGNFHFPFQPLMQPLAEAGRQLEDAVVGYQHHHIARRVQHGRADFAGLQMLVDFGAQMPRPPRRRCRRRCAPTRACSRSSSAPTQTACCPFGRKPFQFRSQAPLQQRARPVQPNLDGSLGNAQRSGGFAGIHLFDVPQQHDVTVNLGQAVDGLAQQRTQAPCAPEPQPAPRANWSGWPA